ncbi:uncharacterized protein LOC106153671 [Lingula anatina]|uniref:Uncharacterized protein LOC106153671 n=1 Tax=Lingula anatina TaxID=7574 RepID=A0A1S3HDI0_LINAN|nr:uncharacterized protein LOC106153671 [Lingula anatina]XP_013383154.1 uncharacterized protein LOC106153671 [Lingula anatina]|eukprot:XP_013383153.1 uncharacterized protein LOC106153671 [Lingula anatina]
MSNMKVTGSPPLRLNKVVISYLPNTQFKDYSRKKSPEKLSVGNPRTSPSALPDIAKHHSVEHEIVRLDLLSGRGRDKERRPSLVSNQSASCPDLNKQGEHDTLIYDKEQISPRSLHRKLVPRKSESGLDHVMPEQTHFVPSPPKSAAATHNAKNNRQNNSYKFSQADRKIRGSSGSLVSLRGHAELSKTQSDGFFRSRAHTVDASTYYPRPRYKLREQQSSFATPPLSRRKGYVLRVDSHDKIDVSSNIKELALHRDESHTTDVTSSDLVHFSSKVSTISNSSYGPRQTQQTRGTEEEENDKEKDDDDEEEVGPSPQIVVKCQNWLKGLEKANQEKCLDDIACITYSHV